MKLLIVTQKVDARDQLLGFFIRWIEGFARRCERVTVLCLESRAQDLPSNVHVMSMGKYHGFSKIRQAWNFYRLTYVLRHDYDAVFVHMNPIGVVVGAWWWRSLGKKVFLWYTSKGVTLKLRIATWLADGIFTASKESFRVSSSKAMVTGHGIDTTLFTPALQKKAGDGMLHILSVGRIASVKNYGTLVQAIKILNERGTRVTVTMVGEPALLADKAYEKQLKSDIARLGLGEHFHFVGKVDQRDLVGYYQSHDLFVHMSKTGSLDKSILEAMASGMQVVSSNDAARAFLPAELTVDDRDDIAVADAIERLGRRPADPQLRTYVVDHHNLDRLLDAIVSHITTFTP